MKKIAWNPVALLGAPELSTEERAREQRKQEIRAALDQARSRLDTIHGLVRQEKKQDADLIVNALVIDLANLLMMLRDENPTDTSDTADTAAQILARESGGQWDEQGGTPSPDQINDLFWKIHRRAHRTITSTLKTSLDYHEAKYRRWLVTTTVLLAGTLIIFIASYRRAKASLYRTQLNNRSAMVDIIRAQPYIRHWLMTDTIDAPHGFGRNIDVDFLETAGGEPRMLPTAGGKSLLIDKTHTTWNPVVSQTDAVNISALVGHRDDAVAYAFTTIHSPRAQTATLFLGSDDGIKVWLNGKVVFRMSRLRVLKQDEDQVKVNLRKGVNALLLKITQDRGPWGFSCRLEPGAER